MAHKDQLLRVYSRTYNNCIFYEKENRKADLLNEIGVLRGIAYCIEEIVGEDNLFHEINFYTFKHYIDIQQNLKDGLAKADKA